jgi:hypothetical protein
LANAQGGKNSEEPVVTASDATPVVVSTELPAENESSAASEVEKQVNAPEDILPAELTFPETTTTAVPKN